MDIIKKHKQLYKSIFYKINSDSNKLPNSV